MNFNLFRTETDANGSWSEEIGFSQFFKAVPLTEWYVICYSKHKENVKSLIDELISTSKCINYNLHFPIM